MEKYIIYLIVGIFILLDFLSGFIAALATGTFASSAMRKGLYHKSAEILAVATGVAVDVGQNYLDLGVTVPVAGAVCVYIILMETGSIFENIYKINPDLVPSKMLAIMGMSKAEKEDDSNGS